ncbi:hypothetical protein DIPPA_29351 [Diplonema papillatum]|nr:hypothetical protein DIPPA_29351 [Diplonema papillatum]
MPTLRSLCLDQAREQGELKERYDVYRLGSEQCWATTSCRQADGLAMSIYDLRGKSAKNERAPMTRPSRAPRQAVRFFPEEGAADARSFPILEPATLDQRALSRQQNALVAEKTAYEVYRKTPWEKRLGSDSAPGGGDDLPDGAAASFEIFDQIPGDPCLGPEQEQQLLLGHRHRALETKSEWLAEYLDLLPAPLNRTEQSVRAVIENEETTAREKLHLFKYSKSIDKEIQAQAFQISQQSTVDDEWHMLGRLDDTVRIVDLFGVKCSIVAQQLEDAATDLRRTDTRLKYGTLVRRMQTYVALAVAYAAELTAMQKYRLDTIQKRKRVEECKAALADMSGDRRSFYAARKAANELTELERVPEIVTIRCDASEREALHLWHVHSQALGTDVPDSFAGFEDESRKLGAAKHAVRIGEERLLIEQQVKARHERRERARLSLVMVNRF